jgi:hypothetical protein
MATSEFYSAIEELRSPDAATREIGLRRLCVLMHGTPATSVDEAKAQVRECCESILQALEG